MEAPVGDSLDIMSARDLALQRYKQNHIRMGLVMDSMTEKQVRSEYAKRGEAQCTDRDEGNQAEGSEGTTSKTNGADLTDAAALRARVAAAKESLEAQKQTSAERMQRFKALKAIAAT